MLTLKQIRQQKEQTIARLAIKGVDATAVIEQIIELDDARKALQRNLDDNLAEQNGLARQIGVHYKNGEAEQAEQLKLRTAELKEQSAVMTADLDVVTAKMDELIISLPNCPAEIVPAGRTAEDNVCVKQEGDMPKLPAGAVPHWEICKKFDIIDFELGNKLTGAGFPVFKGRGARLERALINFFVDCNVEAGYTEIMPPLMINEASGFGTGQLPDKEGQMYHATQDNYYLIPTAEVPLTNMYRDVIVEQRELPIKITAYTPCFRREAGSYGKDVRGLNRLHQFDKVEVVQVVAGEAEVSYAALQGMVDHVESIVRKLGLSYRILRLCGGDTSFTAALTYDFEVYSAGQDRWLEVSSVSNFESFQANRLKLRYRDADRKTALAHTLNGSSLALPRILAALLENYQIVSAEGEVVGVRVPECLVPYTGFSTIE